MRYSLLMKYLLAIICIALCQPVAGAPYTVEVDKSERSLIIKRDEQVVTRYKISHGRGGKGDKIRQGDNKTPVGAYRVVAFKTNSKFHFFIQLNYPNPLDAWRGYANRLISAEEFRQIMLAHRNNSKPPQSTGIGGYIGLHGIGPMNTEKQEIHRNHNWTEGCIAVNNEEIHELRKYISLGTRVVIRE